MNRTPSLAPLLALAVLALPCLAQSPAPGNAPAATQASGPPADDSMAAAARIVLVEVDGRPLTLADALDAFLSSHTGHGVLVRGEAALRELVGRLMERELFLTEARTLGLFDDAQLQVELDQFLRGEIVQDFWQRELKQRLQVGEDEVEAFYAKTDVALKLTLIETRERASCEALRARVAAGEDMGALAARESTHASRSLGGLLPYVRRGELEAPLEKEAFALETPLGLTPVVALEGGFAFARLEERSVNPTRLPREVALPQIRKILRDRLEDKLREEIETRLEKQGEITLDATLLQPEMLLDKADAKAVVARSRGRELHMSELRDALDLENLRQREAETVQGAARFVARDWAMRQVIWDESETNGRRSDPAIVARVDRQRREGALGLLCQRYIYAGIEPSEDDLRAYYERNKESSFTRPPERRLAYIVVATEGEGLKLLERCKAGESFETLAKQASMDRTSAVHGGRIGWIKKGDILPEVEARAFALAKDAIDGPIETSAGWFLLHVIDTKDAELVPFAGARVAVEKRLIQERQKDARTQWSERLKERATVRIDEEGMRAAVEWLARQPAPQTKPVDPNSKHAPPGAAPDAPASSAEPARLDSPHAEKPHSGKKD